MVGDLVRVCVRLPLAAGVPLPVGPAVSEPVTVALCVAALLRVPDRVADEDGVMEPVRVDVAVMVGDAVGVGGDVHAYSGRTASAGTGSPMAT